MINENLKKYVDEAKKRGMDNTEIGNNLLNSGWDKNMVAEILSIDYLPVPTPPNSVINLNSHGMWDAFEHIIMFISLYVSATSLGLILHFYVNKLFPGLDTYNIRYGGYEKTLLNRYYSALIVASPVFLILFFEIARKTKLNPNIKSLGSRKTLIYLTLIITFITVLINLSSIIYNLLMGNVSINFVLHFLITVGISGIIFFYYVRQVAQDRKI